MRRITACVLALLLPLAACSLGDKEPGKDGSQGTNTTHATSGPASDSSVSSAPPATPTTDMTKWRGKIQLNSRPAPPPEQYTWTVEIQGDKLVVNETGWEAKDKPRNVSKTITADKKKLDTLNSVLNQLRTFPTTPQNIGGETAIVELQNGAEKVNAQVGQGDDAYQLIVDLYKELTKE